MTEFDKCNFCRNYIGYCPWRDFCDFDPSVERFIEKAKEKKITVTDVIGLVRLAYDIKTLDFIISAL